MSWFTRKKETQSTTALQPWAPRKSEDSLVVEGQVLGEVLDPQHSDVQTPESRLTIRAEESEENKEIKKGFTKNISGFEMEYMYYNKRLRISYEGTTIFDEKLRENIKEKVTHGEVATIAEEIITDHLDKVLRYEQWADAYKRSSEKYGRLEESEGEVVSTFQKYEVKMDVHLIIQWVTRMEGMEAPAGATPVETKNSGYDLVVVLKGKSVRPGPHEEEKAFEEEVEPFTMTLDAGSSPTDYLDRIYYYGAQYFVDIFDPQRNAKDMLEASLNKHSKRNRKRSEFEENEFEKEDASVQSMDELDKYLLQNGKGGTGHGEDLLRKTVLQENRR